jgi:hypothetical protein
MNKDEYPSTLDRAKPHLFTRDRPVLIGDNRIIMGH